MPLYFFDRVDGGFDADREGTELPDMASARLEAIRFAGETVRDNPEKLRDAGTLRVEVSNDVGAPLCTVTVTASDAPSARASGGHPAK